MEPGRLVRSALKVDGSTLMAGRYRTTLKGRIFLVAVGKAAGPMALSAHRVLKERVARAIVIAPQETPSMPRTRAFIAGHPIPDARGVRASQRVIQLLERADRNDIVLLLLSGGASALMPAPISGVSLRQKQRLTRLLLLRGASIREINAVRRQLSRLKGGRFARLAAPARVITLALSDVPGDDPSTIGSGPALFDAGAKGLARRTVKRYLQDVALPPAVAAALMATGGRDVQPRNALTLVIGSGRTFARAAAQAARRRGFRTKVLADALKGEARQCGPGLVARFTKLRRGRPACLIATGETVVKVRGPGRGGRNQELALSAVPALGRARRATVLAAFATDGRDGASGAAGGIVDDHTAGLASDLGVSVEAVLDLNDSSRALGLLGALIVTGPTATNVADITLILG